MAIKHHHLEIAEYLIERGANVNSVNKTRQSILFNASYDNYIDGARLLLEHKVNVDYQDHRGWTALMVAAHRGHVEMVYLLLKDGRADTTLEDAYGKKAIDRA